MKIAKENSSINKKNTHPLLLCSPKGCPLYDISIQRGVSPYHDVSYPLDPTSVASLTPTFTPHFRVQLLLTAIDLPPT